eukprot:1595503-Rhodomonas_salina.3
MSGADVGYAATRWNYLAYGPRYPLPYRVMPSLCNADTSHITTLGMQCLALAEAMFVMHCAALT